MEAIARTVLQKLSSFAQEEFGVIWNLQDDVQRMRSTVSAIKAVLLDAEAKTNNLQVSNWLEELKDVLYDADDLLDDLSTEALKRKLMGGNSILREVQIFFSFSNQIVYGLKLGHGMKAIQKRLEDIAKIKITLQLTDRPLETPISYREQRQTYSFVSKDEVIGREEEKEFLKSYLLDTNETVNVSVVPIIGIGGLGKTTLAQLVYNDNAVQRYFQQTMWVCVSEEFDIRKIAQKMIGSDKDSEIEQVQQDLRNKIRRKKYLLVLDDVWNEDRELWLKLKSLLMEGGKGSIIIVTTRSRTVAKIMGTLPPFFLKGLDLERSWKLFSRVAFDGGEEPNDRELLAIGRGIVKRCAGVPLAITTIGSLLYSRNLGRSDWLYFKEVEFSKIDQQKDKIFAILKLSYDHLPSFLKNCFAYCSLFPKGFKFDKKTLIQLWIAEGFIQPSNDNRCEEDVGHEYFMNLLSMSLFQDVTIDDYGDVTTCKMHDLIHDLAQLVVGKEYGMVEGKTGNIGNIIRYLSSSTLSHFAQTPSSSHKLRTFIILGQQIYRGQCLDLSHFHLFSSLKCLRVLTLSGLDIVTIPTSIKELKHLRYLDLSKNHFLVNLPPDVSSLHNLQTLKLSQCFRLKELPSHMNKSLRHLELNECERMTCMPCGFGQLTNLQTLTHFLLDNREGFEMKHMPNGWEELGNPRTQTHFLLDHREGSEIMCMPCGLRHLTCLQTLPHFLLDCKSISGGIRELSGLNSLRGKLEIKWLDSLRYYAEEVESAKVLLDKQHLQELELRWWNDENEVRNLPLSKSELMFLEFPSADRRQLNQEFCGCGEDENILEGLQPHNSIKKLVIDGYCGRRLPDWIGNLSSLLSLEINNCNALISLPEGIRNLISLKRLRIYNCSLLEIRCARTNGEDWPKIAHIPKVLIPPFTPSALRYYT